MSGCGIGDKRRRRTRRIKKMVFVQHNLPGHGGERDDGHNQSVTAETGSGMMAMMALVVDTGSRMMAVTALAANMG